MRDEDAYDMNSIECPTCKGRGVVSAAPRGVHVADDADMKPCPACGGTGALHDDRRTIPDKPKVSPLPWGVNARDEKDGPPYEVWTGDAGPIGQFTRIEDALAAVGCVNAAVDGAIDATLQAQRMETMRQHYEHRIRILLSALLPFMQEYESAILVPVQERRAPRASITEFKRAFEAIKCPPSTLDCGEPGCEVEP